MPRRVAAALLLAAMVVVGAVRSAPLWGTDPEKRPEIHFEAENGRSYPYVVGWDSYAWLRQARNLLQTGTACDEVRDGVCRDTYVYAPVGGEMHYGGSLHAYAIAVVHRIASFFDEGFPLQASALWLQVIVGVAGAIPAFLLASRISTPVGGFVAALLLGLNPYFLVRSIRADNDVWNVIMPVWVVWAFVRGLQARGLRTAAGFTVLASLLILMHAHIWDGWIIGYCAVVCAGALVLLVDLLTAPARESRIPAGPPRIRRSLLVVLGFVALTEALSWATGVSSGLAMIRLWAERNLPWHWIGVAAAYAGEASQGIRWPDNFRYVTELFGGSVSEASSRVWGEPVLGLSWLTLCALATLWRRRTLAVGLLVVAGASTWLVLEAGPWPHDRAMAILGLPWLLVLAARCIHREPLGDRSRAVVVLAVWLLLGLFIVPHGQRYSQMLLPPVAIAGGLLAGSLHGVMVRALSTFQRRQPAGFLRHRGPFAVLHLAAIAVAAALLIGPARKALTIASHPQPRVNDAWFELLKTIRESTSGDTIVNALWDYGYFVKYFADRRVTADGASLWSRVPHWFGRALMAPTEQEALGWLRMLNCGSDAARNPERRMAAIERLQQELPNPVEAYALLEELVQRDRPSAVELLSEGGFARRARAKILAATHCRPPPAVLVLSSEMVGMAAWREAGSWEVQRGAPGPGVAAAEHGSPYLTGDWSVCRSVPQGFVFCPVGARQGETSYESYRYLPNRPAQGVFVAQDPEGGERRLLKPAAVWIAGARGQETVDVGGEGPALLLQEDVRYILAGSPQMLSASFTRLYFLLGTGMSHFEPIARAVAGDEILVAFRIHWVD